MMTAVNIVLAIMIVLLFATWVYAIATYDWSRFEEDQQAIKDDPYSPFP